jgi:lipoprotein-releasing system permease protein
MYRWFIAYKYFVSRLITLVALVAVTISVTVLIVIVSIMEGFRTGLEERIRGSTSDIKIESDIFLGLKNPEEVEELLRMIPGIKATAPVVETFALRRPEGLIGASQEAVDQYLIALDLDNDLSRGEFEESLRGLPDRLDTGRLNESSRALVQRILDTQPRTVKGLFSEQWIERDLWEPWGRHLRKPDIPLRPIVVGVEFFRKERILPGVPIRLTSFSPDVREPLEESFLVVGFFKTGLYEIDSKGMILRMEDAERFLQLRDADGNLSVSGIRVQVEEGYEETNALVGVRKAVESRLAENKVLFVKTETWREKRAPLLKAVMVEKVIVSVILGAVILFAGFMIFIILTVQVVEKARDIGVMQSLGATARGIASIYFVIGAGLCLLGMVLGTIYGVAIGFCLNTVLRWVKLLTGLEIFPQDVYYLDHIPVKFRADDLSFIIVTTLVASLMASVLPAIRAARKNPTEGLRQG